MINTVSKINLSKIGGEGGGSTLIWIMSVNILFVFFDGTPYKVPPIFFFQTSSNSAVAALLQLVSYFGKFLSKFYIFHIDIYNLHLQHQTNCQNKQKYMF